MQGWDSQTPNIRKAWKGNNILWLYFPEESYTAINLILADTFSKDFYQKYVLCNLCDYSIIIPAVYKEYGDRLGYIWEQYTCYGKSPKELKAMGYDDVDNYVAFTRKVKRFILNRLLPNNPILRELVKNRK